MNLKNKTVLIPGATGGLGQSITYLLSKEVKKIIILARNEKKVKSLIKDNPKIFDYYLLDFSDRNQLINTCKKIKKKYASIDILLNIAGVGTHKKFSDSSLEDLGYLMKMNLNLHLIITKELLSHLLKGSFIVNIGTVAESISLPYMGNYSIAKSGLQMFSRVLRLELKEKQVRVLHVTLGPLKNKNFDKNMLSTNQGNNKIKKISTEYAAEKIVSAIKKNKSHIYIPWYFKYITYFDFLFKEFSDKIKLKITK